MTTFAESSTSPSVDPNSDTVDFASLGLPRQLVETLARQGITTPFEIQRATLPDSLAGRDVLGRGQTGSGKTLAFGLPVIARLADRNRARPLYPRALVLVPTRELAMQVNDALVPLGKSVGVFLKTAVGGVPYDRQIDALRRGVEIVVATPGRLGDLIERGVCRLDDVEITVLDEADQMADMGFLPEVTQLLAKTPADAQRLLFSATLDNDVDSLVKRFMTDPVTHSTAPATAAVSTMDHHLLLIPPHDKFAVAASIAAREGRTMLFARTQLGVDRLVEQLAAVGVRAGGLHGGKTQRMRTKTLAEFREGRTPVLVATDVAARGIHVDGVSLVLHVDPPKDPKDYLHRAGRTARAGESGAVATLVLPKQRRTTLAMMEKAGVEPAETRVRAGDEALAQLIGAREPSGVPVRNEPEPRRGGGPRRFGDRDGRGFDRGGRGGFSDRGERRFGDRDGRGERRYGDRPAGERFADRGGDRRFGDRPAGEGYSGERSGGGERRFGQPERRDDRSFGDRRSDGRSFGEQRSDDRGQRSDRFGGQRDDRRFGERADRTFGDRNQPATGRGYDRDERRNDDRPGGSRGFGDRRQEDRPQAERRFGDRGDARPAERRSGGFRTEGRGRDDRRGFGGRPPARTH
ncbi:MULTISPECIES: DEAD/DEAH box helicase [unclassified Micromonospora]|uniref:DEAD/DEAH box helicase n=1 Tax=unclassified Micromonospora TaxID=2617518 RepID=UPI001B360467|nr:MULTISPECIES: DEAD/DEAH box helicase [unclassified Micromonospora]MBQ1041970.1 DEAD/DEAH box helicase [Micromonospora sp. C72]MBQ1054423.1 DEAD/DEAH box helicase [Micromonospora sp. C32]